MDNLTTVKGESRVRDFLQTLTEQEKVELLEEVRAITDMKTLDLGKTMRRNKSLFEFEMIDDD